VESGDSTASGEARLEAGPAETVAQVLLSLLKVALEAGERRHALGFFYFYLYFLRFYFFIVCNCYLGAARCNGLPLSEQSILICTAE